MTRTNCRLTAKNRDQLRNPTLGNRVRATFTFLPRLVILQLVSHQPVASRQSTQGQRPRAVRFAGDKQHQVERRRKYDADVVTERPRSPEHRGEARGDRDRTAQGSEFQQPRDPVQDAVGVEHHAVE